MLTDTFPGPGGGGGKSRSPTSPGRLGVSHGGRGDALLSGGAEFRLLGSQVVSGQCLRRAWQEARGHASGGGGGEGVGAGFPSPGPARSGGSARAGSAACPGLRSRDPAPAPAAGSPAAPAAPAPRSLRAGDLGCEGAWGGSLTSHGTGTCSREVVGGTGTPQPPAAPLVVERPPFAVPPSSAFPPPEAAEQGHQRPEA